MLHREFIAVALGGALGTLARVGALEASSHLAYGSAFATLAANTLGALGLAFVMSRGLPEFPAWVGSGITVGFFGSYTTFSAVALITVNTTVGLGLGYLALTLVSGVLAVLSGRALGLRFRKRLPQ